MSHYLCLRKAWIKKVFQTYGSKSAEDLIAFVPGFTKHSHFFLLTELILKSALTWIPEPQIWVFFSTGLQMSWIYTFEYKLYPN